LSASGAAGRVGMPGGGGRGAGSYFNHIKADRRLTGEQPLSLQEVMPPAL